MCLTISSHRKIEFYPRKKKKKFPKAQDEACRSHFVFRYVVVSPPSRGISIVENLVTDVTTQPHGDFSPPPRWRARMRYALLDYLTRAHV